MVEILYVVFLVIGLVFCWPSGPWQGGWGWAPHIYYLIMFALAGLAIFGLHPVPMLR